MATATYLSAQEARKLTQDAHSLDGAYMRHETDRIIDNIGLAAKAGKSEITVDSTNEIISARLGNLGYQVKITRDQRDGDYMTIKW